MAWVGRYNLRFFAIVAAKVKMNANGAHTFLEVRSRNLPVTYEVYAKPVHEQIVKIRFGTGAHLLFTFYAFLCILVVCGSLLRECDVSGSPRSTEGSTIIHLYWQLEVLLLSMRCTICAAYR